MTEPFDFPAQPYFDIARYIPGDKRKALRKADRQGFDVLIMDDDQGSFILRDMDYGEQEVSPTKEGLPNSIKRLFWKWLSRFPEPMSRIDPNEQKGRSLPSKLHQPLHAHQASQTPPIAPQ